jgi:hypothetical protein
MREIPAAIPRLIPLSFEQIVNIPEEARDASLNACADRAMAITAKTLIHRGVHLVLDEF